MMNNKFDYIEIGTSCFKTLAVSFKNKPDIKGISIEAVSEYFNELLHAMGNDINKNKIFLNVAIDKQEKNREFYFFDYHKFVINNKKNLGLSGIGSFDLDNVKYEVSKQIGDEYFKYIKSRNLKCLTIKKIIDDFKIKEVDIFKIDAEGYDKIILKELFETTSLKPKLIIYEDLIIKRKNPESAKKFENYIENMGYDIKNYGSFNKICFKKEKKISIDCLNISDDNGLKKLKDKIIATIKDLERKSCDKKKIIDVMSKGKK